tara:strand:+ start:431 stop:967 length:537 start_codon:yes stop_codon:yes gene_type:complete
MNSMRWMLKRLNPATIETVDGDGNKLVMSPVAATAQRMGVKEKGSGSGSKGGMNANCDEVEENCLILGNEFISKSGLAISSEQRKKKMGEKKELGKHSFETGLEYTFEFYNHLFDPCSFHLNVVGMTTCDVVNVIGQQPIRLMAKVLDKDEYLWDLEMFHERAFNLRGKEEGGGENKK